MAYWLDSAHQPMPLVLKIGLQNGGIWTSFVDKLTRQPGNVNGPRGLKLPDDIASLTALDAVNVLQARGTAPSLEALQKLVSEIDVPLELAFRIMVNADVTQASTILRNGQTLVVRLPGIGEQGRTRLALVRPHILQRDGMLQNEPNTNWLKYPSP